MKKNLVISSVWFKVKMKGKEVECMFNLDDFTYKIKSDSKVTGELRVIGCAEANIEHGEDDEC